jgi:hypothetical protein
MNGETKMKATVFSTPAPISGPEPAFASVAPTMPPIRACELDDGMPYHQVITFHAMAPISAPNTTCWSTMPGSTMPLPTVAATFSWNTAIAMTLKKAAKATACCGFSTPVLTTVAIEFAASWKPFMKSNSSASTTSIATTQKPTGRASIRQSPSVQEFSRTMPSIRFATSSQRSEIDSRCS